MEPLFLTSEAVQNYLKVIYQIDVYGRGASPQEIAAHLAVSAPAVTKMLRQMSTHQMIEYTPYQPVRLTALGSQIALEVIRHHRLLEVYLTQSLGYGWEQVHSEAERLEHHISEEFEDTIDRMLGFPSFDPHGDPIPTRDGRIPPPVTETLLAQSDGARVTVRRVTDEDAALLRYLGERGLRPGAMVQVRYREPFGGPLRLDVAGREERVSPQAAQNVFVQPVAAAPEGAQPASVQKTP